MRWDIFCKVIDNHGDIGVCWRLAADLGERGESVRLWVDDPSALAWMAPDGAPGVQLRPWSPGSPAADPGDAVVEAFGCDLDQAFVAAMAARTHATGRQPAWINLEYLTAESFAERSHGLPSPVLAGPGTGLCKHFFYPGFTPATGGLLRERDLAQRQQAFDRDAWLAALGIAPGGERLVSLFCYEPPALDALLQALAQGPAPTRLLVTAGRAQAAVRAAIGRQKTPAPGQDALAITYLPHLTQRDYDHLLWACDLNFVRGEDSLVRALWAGKPLVWQIYPQHDGAHHAKLQAFLDWLQAPAALRQFHAVWNGIAGGTLPGLAGEEVVRCVAQASRRLRDQADLATQLLAFVAPPPAKPFARRGDGTGEAQTRSADRGSQTR